VLDITTWFDKYSSESKKDSEDVLAQIEMIEKAFDLTIPETLDILLHNKHHTEIWFMDKQSITGSMIFKFIQKYKMDCLPFCGNDEVGMLVLNSKGEVCEWDVDDGVGDVVENSLNEYLEYYRNFLLDGHGEYIEDVGIIEKMTGAGRK
jgi:hypothetical protein